MRLLALDEPSRLHRVVLAVAVGIIERFTYQLIPA
jgi:hypothetical protein